jgi:integrase
MPNNSPRVPKYRRHKPSGQGVVTLDGRDYYLGKYRSAASKEAYQRLTAEWLLNGGRMARQSEEITVVELISAYLKFAEGYYLKDGKPTNEIKSTKRALKVLRELYGRELVSRFGPLALKSVRQRMVEIGWTRVSINKNVDRVRRVFKWGESEEIVPRGVYETLRTVSGLRKGRTEARESEPVRPVPEFDLAATLERLSPTIRDMVLLQRYTGARPGEICGLRSGDVNRDTKVWEYVPGSHKTEHHDKQRVIFIGPKGQEILLPYLLRAAESYCFSPAEVEAARRAERSANRKTPMSCGNRPGSNCKRKPKRQPKERYTTTSFGRAIRRAAEAAGVEVWAPHQLRHSFATEVRKTHGLEAVQVCLGHSQAAVSEIYAERDFALASRVAGEVG